MDDVNVGDVVEFLSPALSHCDDGEPCVGMIRTVCAGQGQGSGDDGVGKVCQFSRDVLDDLGRVVRPDISGGDPHQMTPIGQPQPIRCRTGGPLGHQELTILMSSDDLEQVVANLVTAATHGIVGDLGQVVGMGNKVTAQLAGSAQEPNEPACRVLVTEEIDDELGGSLGEICQGVEGQIRVTGHFQVMFPPGQSAWVSPDRLCNPLMAGQGRFSVHHSQPQ